MLLLISLGKGEWKEINLTATFLIVGVVGRGVERNEAEEAGWWMPPHCLQLLWKNVEKCLLRRKH